MSVLFFANICSRSTSKGTLEPVLQLSIDWRLQVYIWGWICLLFRLFEFNLDFFSQQWRRRRWRRRHIASLSNALLGQYFDWCYQRGREKNQLAEGFISSVNAGNLPPRSGMNSSPFPFLVSPCRVKAIAAPQGVAAAPAAASVLKSKSRFRWNFSTLVRQSVSLLKAAETEEDS